MKKAELIWLLSVILLFNTVSFAQPGNASVAFEKEQRNTQIVLVGLSEKLTSGALGRRMANAGLKNKGENGVTRHTGVVLREISPGKIDILTKVEEGPNNSSIVHMIVFPYHDDSATVYPDSLVNKNVQQFLDSFVEYAVVYSLEIRITEQLDHLKGNEKSYQLLLTEQKELQNKKNGIETRLHVLQGELDKKTYTIIKEKENLEELKVQRENIRQLK